MKLYGTVAEGEGLIGQRNALKGSYEELGCNMTPEDLNQFREGNLRRYTIEIGNKITNILLTKEEKDILEQLNDKEKSKYETQWLALDEKVKELNLKIKLDAFLILEDVNLDTFKTTELTNTVGF